VVNQIGPAAGMDIADLEHIAAVTVDAVVPSRKAVALATNQGVAVVDGAPRDPAARVLRALAKRLHTQISARDPFAAPAPGARAPAGTSNAAGTPNAARTPKPAGIPNAKEFVR